MFIDLNKNVKNYLSAELETLPQQASYCVEPDKLEENHEFLRAYGDIFSSNIYKSKDYTYHDLKSLITNKNMKVLQCDNDSPIIIMDSKKYYEKLWTMENDGIKNGIYKETRDTTLHDLKQIKTCYIVTLRIIKNLKK